jgi:uncharacterized cofD-like protein
MKKIVCIGGGTGTYTVLQGLKHYPLHLSVIVSMTDSGGSNRVIRDEFGLLPTSDLRQCMVALASDETDEILRNLFTYRYSQGTGIQGMTFGNLFMAALTDIYGSQEKAIEKTCEMLQVNGDIIPVTYDNSHLVARYENGVQVLGEHYIDEPTEELGPQQIVEFETIPKASANPLALKAIADADLIVMGPGDLYTSIICNLVIDGVASAISKSKAKKVYVANLMTKFGQTHGFGAQEHLNALEKYLGKGSIDICLINKNKDYPKGLLEKYEEEHASLVKDDLKNGIAVRVDLISGKVHEKHDSDKLKRSLIRHDSKKLASAIMQLL